MNIVFTEIFKKECQEKFNISEEQVQQAIRIPDAQQILKLDNLELGLFIKKGDASSINTYLLVCSRKENGNWLVDVAFTVPLDLVDNVSILEPIIVLQKFVQKFGLSIRVGNQYSKFIFRESIPIDIKNTDPKKLVEIINPSNHSFMQITFIKLEKRGLL